MRFITTLAAAAILAVQATAQTQFQVSAAEAPAHDAALSPAADALFLAVHDHNEVWKVDPATGEVALKAAAGRGPTAVAVSADGRTVAVANRLSGDVSLFRAEDLSPLSTVPTGDGPTDIVRLPGGGFAVVNSFADSLTLIDPADPGAPVSLAVTGVPQAVAASESFLAAGTRVPAALHVFREGARTATAVALPSMARAVAAVEGDRFAVATLDSLLLVDAAAGEIAARRELAASDVAAVGDRIYALTPDSVLELDPSLETVETFSFAGPAAAVAAANGRVAVASPRDRAFATLRTTAEETVVAQAEETGEALQSPGIAPPPVVTDRPLREEIPIVTEPAPSPAPAEEPLPEPAPVEAPAEAAPAEMPAEAPAETPEEAPAESTPAAEPAGLPLIPAPPAEATAEKGEIVPPPSALRRLPLGLEETRAPREGRRPSAMPLPDFSKPTFGETLRQDLGMTQTEGGFRQPSLDVLESIQAKGGVTFDIDENQRLEELRAEDDVTLSLDNTDFASDYFYYNAITGKLEIHGNVQLQQEQAYLTADEIYYSLPSEEALAQMDPAVVGADPASRRLSLGVLDATNLEIREPAREMTAARIHYDFATRTGEIEGFRGRVGAYYFGGERVRVLGPASADGEDVWVTTCNLDPPHYRIRIKSASLREGNVVVGKNARLQFGSADTPVYWPRWAHSMSQDRSFAFDFDSGHSADIGYYVNVGQRFAVNPDLDLGLRLMPTSKEGVGFGVEAYYDFLQTPTSPFYRSKGEIRTMYTTENRGYAELYHRQDILDDIVLRLQVEQWSDEDFYKDFFYEAYRNRTAPRTFANLTYAQPEYIATATLRKATNGFVRETERLPEVTYHLLERRLAEDLYFSFDTVNGYNERETADIHALRSVNVGRLSYVAHLAPALTLTPFVEAEATWYSDEPREDESNTRFSTLFGTTLQSRFHKSYPGAFGFSGFKHVVVPSLTLSYRPEPTMGIEETPRFDAYDNVYGRSRIESKIDNIVFGRDAETDEVWQVARLTLYQGSDFWNELRRSDDYEMEMDLRPRPWWGWLLAAEHHSIAKDYDLDQPYFYERLFLEAYESIVGKPWSRADEFQYNVRYGDYDRLLTYLYYDNRSLGGRLNGRVGYAYTDTQKETFNRELLYGVGYRLGEKWGVAFEQRYDFERGELTRQEYEISRDLHCWEATVQFRDRESGWDVGVEFSIKAFPGTGVKF